MKNSYILDVILNTEYPFAKQISERDNCEKSIPVPICIDSPLFNHTPRKHSLERYIGIGLSVRLSRPTSTSFVRFPPNFVEFKTMMCELCSIKDFYCPLSFTPVMLLWT